MASRLNPYLNFDGNAAQATEFYHCRLPSADCRIPVAPGPKRSVSVYLAGPGPAGQDGSGRAEQRVTLEAIGPLRRCSSVELSTLGSAAGTVRPTSVT